MIRLRSSHRRNRVARLVNTGVGLALVAGILVVWGGLVVAILNLRRGDTEEMMQHRDL